MPGKYSFIMLLLLLSFPIFAQQTEKSRDIAIVINYDENTGSFTRVVGAYLADLAEIHIMENSQSVIVKRIDANVDTTSVKKVINYIFSMGMSAFYHIDIKEEKNFINVEVRLYNSIGAIIYEYLFIIYGNDELSSLITEKEEKRWLEIIRNSISRIYQLKEKAIMIDRKSIVRTFKFEHDFPFAFIGVNALTGKFYFDDRINDRSQKLFSVFPVDLTLKFFPLRYFEVGLFGRFDYQNMVYRYLEDNEYKYYDANFSISYGFLLGLSFFKDNSHFGIGFQMYNLHYDISDRLDVWKKPLSVNGYFLPQFALYQQLSFKIFKIVYFTMLFKLKTLPLFYMEDNYLFSRPFHYDLFTIELTFIGLSIVI